MTSHAVDEVVVLKPEHELCEGEELDALEGTLRALALQGQRVVVDLGETRLLTAHAVGGLAQAARTAAEHGGNVVLCGAARLERWVLDLTRLTEVVPVFGTEEKAVQHLRAGRAVVA